MTDFATEFNFDGLVGPTHNYAGLAVGNLASMAHAGVASNPRAAALQGLTKMHRVWQLGAGQAVLPPQDRPCIRTLRRLGFQGSDAEVLQRVAQEDEHLLCLCSSASAMWTANAATFAPSGDTLDGLSRFTPANLVTMFHRSLEAETTTRVLRAVFANPTLWKVHDPLPASEHFADEGAANPTRLGRSQGAVQVFGWGRRSWGEADRPTRYPARQAYEASAAIARGHRLKSNVALLWQQSPLGIDAGAFHSDVLAVGHGRLFALHEGAFHAQVDLLRTLRGRLGDELCTVVATEAELALEDAIQAYPFNSQVVTQPSGKMAIVAPAEAEQNGPARRFLERVLAETGLIERIAYLDVNASMDNGGGPACLRLRVEMTDDERSAITARVFFDESLYQDLMAWVNQHYRDRLTLTDLFDPQLLREHRTALDRLTQLLRIGSVYDFQRTP